MKKLFICTVAFLVTVSMAMGQKTKTKPAVKTTAKTTPAKIAMKNLGDSFSYAAGMNIATNMKEQGITSLNSALMAKAMDDVFQNKDKALTPDQANNCLQSQMMIYSQKKQAEASKAAAIEAAKGKAFLDSNKNRQGVFVLADGLQFEVIKPGDSTGIKPAFNDTVVINYSGRLIDGTEFDSSIKDGIAEPITWHVNGFIKGWSEVLQMMTRGAHWRVYIPSELGYGERGSGAIIKPGATLIFDMMLIDIKPAAVK